MNAARAARGALGVALCASALYALAEPAVTVRALDLRQKPAADAESVAKVPAETPVDLVARSGAWVQLKSGQGTGWAKVFDVRMGATGAAPARGATGSGIADTLNLASGNRASSVSTGVRGLDAEMLERAQPNFQQVTVLAGFAASSKQAREFAHTGKLTARQVELLPPPQTPSVQAPSR
jgi:hypothetical protein